MLALGSHEALMNVAAIPLDFLDTTMAPSAVVTRDGHIGLWLKLDKTDAAIWNQQLKHATADIPDIAPFDTEWSDIDPWELDEHMIALHQQDASLRWLLLKAEQWLGAVRLAMFSLGWDVDLLDDPPETEHT